MLTSALLCQFDLGLLETLKKEHKQVRNSNLTRRGR